MIWLRNFADRLIDLATLLGSAGLIVILLVILVDVAGRAIGSPLFGSHDLITMTMVVLVFGGMASCDRIGGHLSVDLLEGRYPDWFNRLMDILSAAVGAVIFATLAAAIFDSARLSEMLNLSTNLLNLPRAWFQNLLGIFSVITAIGMALRGVELACGIDIRPGRGRTE